MGRTEPAPRRGAGRLLLAIAPAVAALACVAPSAHGAIAPTLHEAGSCTELQPAPGHRAVRCDDGVPTAGGTEPNPSGEAAVTVPASYRGYKGLPRRAAGAASVPGADAQGNVALDVDVTLPKRRAGRRGFPLLVLMHGCCAGSKTSWQADEFDAAGERWHYSDAWFAARGYAVITYTARGFVNGDGEGSTGQTQLDSRAYEINDFQHLACQVTRAARAGAFDDATGKRVRIDPRRVVATGGSYGGGFTWMALTDPRWRCPGELGAGRARMRLAAAAPKYGWTDLVQSLVPTGMHSQSPGDLPHTRGCDSGPMTFAGEECPGSVPAGTSKRSIVAGLYASGKTGVPPGSAHTTFPAKIDEAMTCLNGQYPYDTANPSCEATLDRTLPEFLRERSAYYQARFFRKVRRRPGWRIPVFVAAAFTDPLFPAAESTRMINRLRSVAPRYPVKSYYGDYQHFVQNKDKEWGDVCATGGDRHVCTADEYVRGFNRPPANLVSTGVTTMLNRFIDHYARPARNRRQRRPRFDVTTALQICPENAGSRPADEPGLRFRGRTLGSISRGSLRLDFEGARQTFSTVLPNPHALDADPVANQVSNSRRCPVHSEPAGPGVAVYESEPLEARRTLIGPTRVRVDFEPQPASAEGVQLNARLYDVLPSGDAVMVDRGPRVLRPSEVAAGRVLFETHGNGWRFEPGHSIRVELAQDDDPFVHRSDSPAALSSLSIEGARLTLPTRER